MTDPAPGVLADLLALASERDSLVETDQLLRELVGPEAVNAAHRTWTNRLRKGLTGAAATPIAARDETPAADGDTLALLQALRATAPAPGAESR